VGIAYSLKFLWAPLMDRVDLPLFKRLKHRRGWMMFSQIVVGRKHFHRAHKNIRSTMNRFPECRIQLLSAWFDSPAVDSWFRNIVRPLIRSDSSSAEIQNRNR